VRREITRDLEGQCVFGSWQCARGHDQFHVDSPRDDPPRPTPMRTRLRFAKSAVRSRRFDHSAACTGHDRWKDRGGRAILTASAGLSLPFLVRAAVIDAGSWGCDPTSPG